MLGLAWLGLAGGAASATPDVESEDLETLLAQPLYGSSTAAAASKRSQDITASPSAIYVRTGGEIRAHGYRTLGEVLESMPGVHLRYDGVYTYAGVRGFARPGDYTSRVLVLVNGVRVNDALYDSASMDREFPIDIELIERVELMPGAGSALYGSNAVIGVVNVITRSASQLGGGQAIAEAGAHRSRKGTVTWGGDLGAVRAVLGVASERRPGQDRYYAAYDDGNGATGVARGVDAEQVDKLFAKLDRGPLAWTTAWSKRVKEVPTGSYDATLGRRLPWMDAYLGTELALDQGLRDGSDLFANVGVAAYRFEADGLYGDDATLRSRSVSEAQWAYGELRLSRRLGEQHRLTTGIEFRESLLERIAVVDIDDEGTDASDMKRRSAGRYGAYVSDDVQINPNLTATVGARLDRGVTHDWKITPRWALVWQATPAWTLKWLRDEAFREPNFSETAYSDSFQRRAEDLDVETVRSTELVSLWRPNEAWTLSTSIFRQRMTDVLELAPLPDDMVMLVNRGRVQARGLESEAGYTSPGGLHVRASVSLQRTTDGDTGRVLTNAPRRLGKLTATVPLSLPGWRWAFNAVYVGERQTEQATRVGGYTRLNTHLHWAPLASPWAFSLGAYNLTDRHYADPAGPEHRQAELPQNGREWRAVAAYRF
jgi:outer membrane receptor protein involved in Fe transport